MSTGSQYPLVEMTWYSIHFVAAAICERFAVAENLVVNPKLSALPGVLEFHPRASLQTCRVIDLEKFWDSMAADLMVRDASYRLQESK